MARTVTRVRYERGVLRPLGRVELEEGEELEVVIVRRRFHGFHERLRDVIVESDEDLLEELLRERR